MAKFSTSLRQAMMAGNGLMQALNGGRVRIFCAATDPAQPTATAVDAPATADDAETGTLMLEITLNGDGVTGLTLEESVPGLVKKPDAASWLCSGVLKSGPIHYWRFVAPGDTGASSQAEARIQGTIGITSGDMQVTSLDVTQGAAWVLNFFNVEAAAS